MAGIPNTLTAGTLAEAAKVSQNFDYLENKTIQDSYYAYDEENSSGLEFAFLGAKHVNDNVVNVIAAGTVTLTPLVINYIEADGTTGAVQAVVDEFTSGNNPLYQVAAGATAFGSGDVTDVRTWAKVGGGGTTYTAGAGLDLTGTEFSIADDGVTDAMIGNRTADPSQAPSGLVGVLQDWIDWFTNRIKAITGKTNWYDAPDTTLAAAATHIAAAAPHTGHVNRDGSNVMTGDLDFDGNEPIGLPAVPSGPTAAPSTAYVDALFAGNRDKLSVRVATTGNLSSLSGLLTIDGVVLIAGDRVLVWKQTTPSENGIYVADAGAWSRASDANTAAEVDAGATVFVQAGNENRYLNFTQIETVTTLGTDPLTWTETGATQFGGVTDTSNSGAGAQLLKTVSGVTITARSLVAGTGITATQNTDDVTVEVDAPSIDIADLAGMAGPAQGGTGLDSYATGDILAASGADTLAVVAGNTTTTKKYLTQVGTGSVSALPLWAAIAGADLPLATQAVRGAVPPGNNLGSTYFYSADGTYRTFSGTYLPRTLTYASQRLYGTNTFPDDGTLTDDGFLTRYVVGFWNPGTDWNPAGGFSESSAPNGADVIEWVKGDFNSAVADGGFAWSFKGSGGDREVGLYMIGNRVLRLPVGPVGVGDGTDVDRTALEIYNGDVNRPKIRYNASGSKWQFSNDGTTWVDFGSGGGEFASQAEAEAGTDTTKYMNPLRTAQAIAALASGDVALATPASGGGTPTNRATGGTAFASSFYSDGSPTNGTADRAFDGDLETAWSGGNFDGGDTLGYDLGDGNDIVAVGYGLFWNGTATDASDITFEGSNDNSTWTTLATTEDVLLTTSGALVPVTNSTSYRYYRWVFASYTVAPTARCAEAHLYTEPFDFDPGTDGTVTGVDKRNLNGLSAAVIPASALGDLVGVKEVWDSEGNKYYQAVYNGYTPV